MAEKTAVSKIKETPPKNEPEKKRSACFTLFLGFLLGLFILFAVVLAGIALAVSATGLVKVPVLSEVLKPPSVAEDFSYKKVSEKTLEKKLTVLDSKGPVNITLTDDELNTLLTDLTATGAQNPNSTLKSVAVKFTSGEIKIYAVLSRNDTPIYAELKIAKTSSTFEFEIQKARLGALPIPGFLIEGVIGQFLLGSDKLLGPPTAESLPVREIVVGDGTITVKGLDLSGLMGPQE